jgi:formate hydrogenlyase subunit 3/multisubunit Na+/H+ antiporter MnhD subunit
VEVVTALGKLSTEPGAFIKAIYGLLLAVSGAIAVLLLMRAGYRIQTSQGKPEAIKEGQEQITATIVGLFFLIFAFVILQVFASDLLKIPGITP